MKGKVGIPRGLVLGSVAEREELQVPFVRANSRHETETNADEAMVFFGDLDSNRQTERDSVCVHS